jgi:tetratricopeptide (TPR) repeat protein
MTTSPPPPFVSSARPARHSYPAAAIQSFRHALDLYQCGGHEHGTLLTLIGLGEALTAAGQRTEALARLRQAGKLLAAQPDPYLEARARASLGKALRNLGPHRVAIQQASAA